MGVIAAAGAPCRIVILGCAGTGKTMLAARLGERLMAPVICLDAIWRPAWSAADLPVFRSIVGEAHRGTRWISDGNFADATFELRLPQAGLIVWLERARVICAARAVRRVLRAGERHRAGDLAQVLRFIWRFDRHNRPRIEALRRMHGPAVPVVRLDSQRAIDRFVAALPPPSA